MRTNEPTESQPWRPLGEKVQKAPDQKKPADKPLVHAPGIVQGPDGRLKTDLPKPKGMP